MRSHLLLSFLLIIACAPKPKQPDPDSSTYPPMSEYVSVEESHQFTVPCPVLIQSLRTRLQTLPIQPDVPSGNLRPLHEPESDSPSPFQDRIFLMSPDPEDGLQLGVLVSCPLTSTDQTTVKVKVSAPLPLQGFDKEDMRRVIRQVLARID